MRARFASITGSLILALCLAGCATPMPGAAADAPDASVEPTGTPEPTPASDGEADAALAQAQAWLDAAVLPPGAVRSDAQLGGFISSTAWPCGPLRTLEAFWTLPGATVADTANWLIGHPTADLVTTAVGPVSDSPAMTETMVGYIPEPGAQEGIVYTVLKAADGVVIRVEIAALTESAVCPPPPGGGVWGAPGLG